MIAITAETLSHRPGIEAVHREAFGGEFEAALVGKLHDAGLIVSSLVATIGTRVIGHILFSHLSVNLDGRSAAAVSLAPMGVLPAKQRQGIGTALVRRGLEDMRIKGRTAVLVVGHPQFYSRFGFSAQLAMKLVSSYAGPAFMALELSPGALAGHRGVVTYPDVFRSA